MKRGTLAVMALAGAVAVVFCKLAMERQTQPQDQSQDEVAERISFEGMTLQAPRGWHLYEPGTRGSMLALKRGASGGAPSLVLEDERARPELPGEFVRGWKQAQRLPGFQPRSVEQFDDAAVDAAGAPCVAIDWGKTARPLQMVCLSSDGRWKLTLLGSSADVAAMDEMVQQLPAIERGL